jgi:hypothetical protein
LWGRPSLLKSSWRRLNNHGEPDSVSCDDTVSRVIFEMLRPFHREEQIIRAAREE